MTGSRALPATHINHEAVLEKQKAANVIDHPIPASDVFGGKASVAMLGLMLLLRAT